MWRLKRRFISTAIFCGLETIGHAGGNVNVGRYDSAHVVPAPRTVTIDGNLSDWDRSGEFSTYRFEEDKAIRYFKGCMMYDSENLYLAAHVGDSSPMMNLYNPAAEGKVAWRGDCLQVRVSSDAKLGWPLKGYEGQTDPVSASDNIAHLTMWYYTPKALACLQIEYGMDYHGIVINPDGFKGAYKKDADGKGYTLEYAISWKLLHAKEKPPKGGDELACVWQMLWSDEQGRNNLFDASEIRNPKSAGFVYQDPGSWGKAIYHKTGNLPPDTVVAREIHARKEPAPGFLPMVYTIPGREQAKVSMQIEDANGNTVRWLLGEAARVAGKNAESWNGLNDDGDPVPPGRYRVRWCYHRDVRARLLATANNAGNPPYHLSDNTGSWAGDYGTPVAVTANATHVFL
ncbi:MAG: hypothetical protein HY360_27265, partial [Verrucomicrobia bacterium]|nr:hypothetical protein [Verrucomicrobiota bacterium]